MSAMIRTGSRAAAFAAALLLVTSPASAQGGATLRGRITDAVSHRAIAMAEVILASDSRSVRSDSDGNYVFTNLPAGTVELLVRARRFPVRRMVVELTSGEVLDGSVALDSTRVGRDSAQSLPPLHVSAAAPEVSYRLRDFERRRSTGRGQYITDDELRNSTASNLQDAVRGLRGVDLECAGAEECHVHMARAQPHCTPDYYVDGQLDNEFGPTTPIRDIVGLEVYTGAAEVPGEFAGRSAGCGVIVIWTRSAPAGG